MRGVVGAREARLPIRFRAVFHCENLDSFAPIVEANAVVADAYAILGWVDVRKLLDVSLVGRQEARQAVKNAQRGLLIKRTPVNDRYVAVKKGPAWSSWTTQRGDLRAGNYYDERSAERRAWTSQSRSPPSCRR